MNNATGLPPPVEAFLRDRVESLEHLEIVVMLHGAPGRVFTAEEIAKRVPFADAALLELVAKGLVERLAGGYRAAGVSEPSAWLAASYAEHAVAVVRYLSALAIDRVRSSAARAFADAFVVGRKPTKKRDEDA